MDTHITVLASEGIEALRIRPNDTIVDATLGSCGHARGILSLLGREGTFVGIDVDPSAIERARTLLAGESRIHLCVGNFADIETLLNTIGITTVDAILADLGWRMDQFRESGKGFSFTTDEPLIMTFGNPEGYPFTAHDVVNTWEEENIAAILEGYGEERYARRIARAITGERESGDIKTTKHLVSIIEAAVPSHYRRGKIHPATKTFQAIRIAVNDELQKLTEFLRQGVNILNREGRLAIITFHSLEDRIVKHTFRTYEAEGLGRVLTKKPIGPSEEERTTNPRSRSAKLRIFERT